MNILTGEYRPTGNYLCTWETQEAVAHRYCVRGDNIPAKQRNAMNDRMLFGEDSLYHLVPRAYRGGIFLLLDDGWDVAYDTDAAKARERFGSVIPDGEKFPGYGATPTEKLKTLSDKVIAMGYAGLGLWICAQMVYEREEATLEEARIYWSERARWCREAGVRYWKVDWGRHSFRRDYLEMMTECVKAHAPELMIEHAIGQRPFEGVSSPEDPKAGRMADIWQVSDVFRTYDVLFPFVDDTTLCRLDALLSRANPTGLKPGCRGLVNVESSPLIAAGLGVNMGIMYGGRNVEAALSWQRMAPPMAIGEVEYRKSERRLKDCMWGEAKPVDWTDYLGRMHEVTAPAVMARGTQLPCVEEMEEPPFVLACCHRETKAYTVATLHRVLDPNPRLIVPAAVTVFPHSLTAPIGIFGCYKQLSADFGMPIPPDAKVYAQCMLDGEAFEVTDQVTLDGSTLIMDGKRLRLWGRSKNALGYEGDPAVAIRLVTEC